MSKIQNIKSKKLLICHDFTRDLKMYKLNLSQKKLIKKNFKNVKFIDFDPKNKNLRSCEIYWGDLINKDKLRFFKNLKWIHLGSSGFDKLKEANLKGIILTNSKGVMTQSVSDTIFSYIFYFSRGIDYINKLREEKKINRKNFDKHFDNIKILSECNFIIFGNGEISKKFSFMLKNFSNNIKIFSAKKILNLKKEKISKSQFFKKSDFIINLLPSKIEFFNYFDKSFFKYMNKNSHFINVGRGISVNETDLYQVLKTNRIKGAALDVFKNEPVNSSNIFLDLNNCLVTPHIAGWFNNYWKYETELFQKNLKSYIRGTKLKNIIHKIN